MLFGGSKFGMVHIGDSRAYLLRDGEFVQITRDDTYVQLLVDEGRITAEEANTHPQKSLLMRALDGRDADPEYSVRQAVPGDRYLICSDGLSGVVCDETIAATMREYSDPNQCAERLIQLALRGGGPDNITVIVADVTDEDIVEESPVVGGAAANDRGMVSSADASTPAARASALTQPRERGPGRAAPPGRADAGPRRHPVRTALILVVLAGAARRRPVGGWRYTQSQYYVGRDRRRHGRGLPGHPGPDRRLRPVHCGLSQHDPASTTSRRSRRTRSSEGIGAPTSERGPRAAGRLLDPAGTQPAAVLPAADPAAAPPPTTTAEPGRPPLPPTPADHPSLRPSARGADQPTGPPTAARQSASRSQPTQPTDDVRTIVVTAPAVAAPPSPAVAGPCGVRAPGAASSWPC